MPDVLYCVGATDDDNEELRYSLRSLSNFPHGDVWVFGHCPDWLARDKVLAFPTVPLPDKFDNRHQSLCAAIDHTTHGELVDFYLFDDDMYVMQRFDGRLPVHHLGPLADYIDHLRAIGKTEANPWLAGLVEMHRFLRCNGVPHPLCYEGHSPLPFTRQNLEFVTYWRTPHFLPFQFYPLLGGDRGVLAPDAKPGYRNHPDLDPDAVYLSSTDRTWGRDALSRRVRAAFPEPCEYERA